MDNPITMDAFVVPTVIDNAPKGHKGWDVSSLTDIKGVSQLNTWLCADKKQRFLPEIRCMDTYPGLDGTITFGEKDAKGRTTPVGIVDVQVKSVASTPFNTNRQSNLSDYKYDCDVAAFLIVKRRVSKNPVVLIIVDTESGRCFRIHLTRDYVDKLRLTDKSTSKTIYFNDSDALSDHDEFYNELASRCKVSQSEYLRALNHCLICPDDISEDGFRELSKQVNRINYECDTKLAFLKQWSFKETWKIGLLYKEEDNRYYLALVAMEYGKEDCIDLRSLATKKDSPYLWDVPLAPGVNDDAHFAVSLSKDFSYSEAVDHLLALWCREFTKTWFIPPESMSDDLICELSFYYLDILARWIPELAANDRPVHYHQDEMDAKQLTRCVEAIPHAIENRWLSLSQSKDEKKNTGLTIVYAMPGSYEHADDWLRKDVISFINGKAQYASQNTIQVLSESISIRYMLAVAQEANSRSMPIRRLWKLTPQEVSDEKQSRYRALDMVGQTPFDFTSSREDFEDNFARYIESLGKTREKAALIFFGDEGLEYLPKHSHDCTLYVDDFFATYRAIVIKSDTEKWKLIETKPYEEDAPYSQDVIEELVRSHGMVHTIQRRSPLFIGGIPLYESTEKYLFSGIRELLGNNAVKQESFMGRVIRKDSMGYIAVWNPNATNR